MTFENCILIHIMYSRVPKLDGGYQLKYIQLRHRFAATNYPLSADADDS